MPCRACLALEGAVPVAGCVVVGAASGRAVCWQRVDAGTGAGHGLGGWMPQAPALNMSPLHPRQDWHWADKLKEKLLLIWETARAGRAGAALCILALHPKALPARLHRSLFTANPE